MANPRSAQYAEVNWAVAVHMAPGVPQKVALAGGASAGKAVQAGSTLRIISSTPCQYRVGSGAQVAVADDNDLPANTVEYITLLSTQDNIAFFSAAAGTVKVAVCSGAP